MRFITYLSIFLFFSVKLSANPVECLISAIENRCVERIVDLFDSIEPLNSKEAKKITSETYKYFHKKYPSILPLNSEEDFLKKLSLFACKSHHYRKKPYFRGVFLNPYPFNFDKYASQRNQGLSFLSDKKTLKMMRISEFLLNSVNFAEDDFPADLVIGGVEMLVGALICILPIPGSQLVGITVITDGVRRSFDGVTQMDERNRARLFSFDY